VQRRPNVLVDVRGSGLRPDHNAVIFRNDRVVEDVRVVRHKYASQELIQLLLQLDPTAATGDYTLSLVAPDGSRSNTVVFKVVR
jgi:hypothetical protein